jgi:hypothetical protein
MVMAKNLCCMVHSLSSSDIITPNGKMFYYYYEQIFIFKTVTGSSNKNVLKQIFHSLPIIVPMCSTHMGTQN